MWETFFLTLKVYSWTLANFVRLWSRGNRSCQLKFCLSCRQLALFFPFFEVACLFPSMTSQMVQWKRTIMRLSENCWFSHYIIKSQIREKMWLLVSHVSLFVCLRPQVSALPGSVFNLAPPHMFGNRLNPNSTMAALIAQSEASPAGTAATLHAAVHVCLCACGKNKMCAWERERQGHGDNW